MMKRLTALTALTMTAGCTVGPNYRPPELPLPDVYAGTRVQPIEQASQESVDPAHWWRSYGDPKLEKLIEQALRDSPNIGIAASRIRQARARLTTARAAGLPRLDASGNVTRLNFSENAGLAGLAGQFGGGGGATGGAGGSGTGGGIALPGDGITTYGLGLDADWEIDLFGGARRGVEGARARIDASIWSRRDAAVTLAAEVAQTYFALRLDQAQARILEQEIARQGRALEIAGHVAQVGLTPQIDVTRQRGSITASQARLEPIRADIDLRVHGLGLLLGLAPAALAGDLVVSRIEPAPPAVPAGLPSDLLRRRPDIRAAERELAAATADIGVAVADLYPRFTLTGMAQLLSSSLSNLFTGDSLQLTGSGTAMFPILDFGRRRAEVGNRRETREQAYQTYRTTVLGALRDVEDALSRIASEQRRNGILRKAVVDREATVRSVEALYRTGFVAQDSLLNAQADVLSSREDVASSDNQLCFQTASLFKAIGGGWNDETDAAGARLQNRPGS
ncbi:efflux transporter outer membrane subunit [Sphingomonas sp. PP-CC-3G-468]|uniref:efflux transporter outer membrane subunit n=1 Tax=Sphingomonas sp. PP-CC-3G-468 TaxID=2135656 RepID=UPI00104C515E|nr:efflux transporter outer membrane subunit [Sphingomonas sp. PP-CC-3G-468]TCM07438.1 NodT family efflux transporter outer membrane factor (OMF) lipoprotein [Sphingomonas sp. PP-CC-3G-468]